MKPFLLPNGNRIMCQTSMEANFLYSEIFEDQHYFQHGIKLPDNAVVFDAGANIGLFSLFVLQHYPTAQIYAFEPSSTLFEIFKTNTNTFSNRCHAFQKALGANAGMATFHFYPTLSTFSGFFVQGELDKTRFARMIQNKVGNQYSQKALEKLVESFTGGTLAIETETCPVTTLSQMISDHHISQIDLLKIDVERAEWDVINGLTESDWLKIKQVVIEVHEDTKMPSYNLEAFLNQKGFTTKKEIEDAFQDADVYSIYAKRTLS